MSFSRALARSDSLRPLLARASGSPGSASRRSADGPTWTGTPASGGTIRPAALAAHDLPYRLDVPAGPALLGGHQDVGLRVGLGLLLVLGLRLGLGPLPRRGVGPMSGLGPLFEQLAFPADAFLGLDDGRGRFEEPGEGQRDDPRALLAGVGTALGPADSTRVTLPLRVGVGDALLVLPADARQFVRDGLGPSGREGGRLPVGRPRPWGSRRVPRGRTRRRGRAPRDRRRGEADRGGTRASRRPAPGDQRPAPYPCVSAAFQPPGVPARPSRPSPPKVVRSGERGFQVTRSNSRPFLAPTRSDIAQEDTPSDVSRSTNIEQMFHTLFAQQFEHVVPPLLTPRRRHTRTGKQPEGRRP
ncbi:hypothetical protein STANM309S_05765 [Streptomyces tanashiensis]